MGKGLPAKRSPGPLREVLVEHLLHLMEHESCTIDAAGVPGYPRPRRLKLGIRRSRLRPDVMARDGRRTILGIVLNESQMREALPDQLDAFARNCRLLVICVTEEVADEAIGILSRRPTPHWGRMRLLRYPETTWEEMVKAAKQERLRDLARPRGETCSVHVLPDGA